MTETLENCPVCSGPHQAFESWLDSEQALAYRVCERCGLVFQSPRMSESELASFYAQGYRTLVQGTESITDKDLRIQTGRARHLIEVLQHLRILPTEHLDIGASSGILLQQSRSTFEANVVGVEPGQEYRASAVELGLEYHAGLDEISPQQQFDLISMIHVLEHLPDPVDYLTQLRKGYLKSKGTLLLEVPNLFGHSSYEVSHLTAFSSQSLRRCLNLAGFKVITSFTHGKPRSPILRLYLTILAQPSEMEVDPAAWRANLWLIHQRRAFGTWFRNMMSYRLPNWTWKEYPEL
ncbi:MAG: class I SAM-dependent methyltransferase [Anaerolineales bacterium]